MRRGLVDEEGVVGVGWGETSDSVTHSSVLRRFLYMCWLGNRQMAGSMRYWVRSIITGFSPHSSW